MEEEKMLEKKLSEEVRKQLPLGMLLSRDVMATTGFRKIAKSEFHKSEQYTCYAFHKAISRIVDKDINV